MVAGFVPWIAYWAMIGSVSFHTAVLVAFGLSLGLNALSWARGQRPKVLELGGLAVFAVILLVTFTTDDSFLERWIQPLTNGGLLAIVLASLLLGRPFTLEYAREQVPPEVAALPGFTWINKVITGVWALAFAVMTAASLVPPIVEGDATMREGGSTLSIVGYWVVPFTVLGLAGIFSARFPDWFTSHIDPPPAEPAAWPALLSLPPADAAGGLALSAEPARALLDEPLRIGVAGAGPGERLTLLAETTDIDGHPWRSTLHLRADEEGTVQLDRDPVVEEPGADPDPMRPIWAMGPAGPADLYIPPPSAELSLIVTGRSGRAAGARARRDAVAAGTRVTEVDEKGVRGRLYLPAGEGAHPAVALFGGSEGGIDNSLSEAAGLLAARGHAALTVGLFGAEGLPDQLAEIPLERFAAAVEWLAVRPWSSGRVATVGISKGAEGMLTALTHGIVPEVVGAVAISPSAVVWQAIGEQGPDPDTSSWTLAGDPVPYKRMEGEALMPELLRNALLRKRDRRRHRTTLLHLAASYAFSERDASGTAAIAVERIGAPLLLLAGEDDELWPSARMAQVLLERREANGVAGADELRSYAAAGHLIRMPHLPAAAQWADGIAFGGTPAGLAAAQADVGPRILAFLGRRLSG
jgi:dienelactone hydrolase